VKTTSGIVHRVANGSIHGVASLAAGLLFAAAMHGQIVAWDVTGVTAVAQNPFAATMLNASLASASLTLGAGVNASATSNTFGGSGFDQTSLANAITAGDYLSFTVTPAATTSFSLSSLSLLFGVGTAVTNFNLALMANVSGFTTGDALWTYSFSTASPAAQNVGLGGFAALQELAAAIEFRVYGWRDTTGTSTFRIRDNAGNDLALSGSVSAIPEPSTYATIAALLGFAVAVGVRWKRRRFGAPGGPEDER
jgi:hypothetical protein